MDPKTSPEYLSYLAARLDEFIAAFDEFLTHHVEFTEQSVVGRGIWPAASPKEDADETTIHILTGELNRLAGALMDLSNIASAYINVQGTGPVDPFINWGTILMPKPLLEPSDIRGACLRAVGRLEGLQARAAALTAPSIDPVLLHPLVWSAAQRLWNDGHLRLAVAATAEAVTGQMKQLTGRNDAPDTSLWQQAFSNSAAEPGKPRLRWPGEPSDQDVKTMNDGLRMFSAGANMVIRNPATHDQSDLTEQEALERLAALSVLAHLVDKCTVETVDHPEQNASQVPVNEK